MTVLHDVVRSACDSRAPVRYLLLVALAALVTGLGTSVSAKEANWIWSSAHAKNEVPPSVCYFRKSFITAAPLRVQATVTADDEYELYVNGHQVGTGRSARQLDEYNLTNYVRRGRNTIAIKVMNRRGSTAAVAARVFVRDRNAGWVTYSTDDTWLANLEAFPFWNAVNFNDRNWTTAQSFGRLGETAPWDREEDVAAEEVHHSERFRISREFEVERVVDEDSTGSLIAMAFNEFGHVVASREGGPLLLVVDSDKDGTVDDVRVYCEDVKNVQGILPLNGDVYVTADGPQGNGMYCLSDTDRDGKLETSRLLFKFRGEMGEHGAHGLTLGPDGWIYVVIGNHSSPLTEYDAASPHRGYYEGDLVGPRYEDPGGHAAGEKAPGGTIIRTNLEGDTVQLVAGGLRNVYDLTFNADGELFVHDSDMESDQGTTWYRPTRVSHVIPGAGFGWRSGWAKWPEYYLDSLPSIADTGRGSPTGATCYQHVMFPQRFWNALFLADWSEGRILVARLKRNGASYTVNTEVLLEGQPLNVTDLAVGPDGWLYFVTGGRGTGGGIYRVTWKGQVPDSITNLGTGIAPAIRQPQLQSAWARQKVAMIRQKLAEDWGPMLVGVARSTANPAHYRTRAVDLLQLYGPSPDTDLLLELAADQSEDVRAKAAELMGIYSDEQTKQTLLDLIEDSDSTVRRKAMEALVRAGHTAPGDTVAPRLASDDRFEVWAARRLLERTELETWKETVLTTDNHRIFSQGAMALLIAEPSEEHALAVIERAAELMKGFVSDRDFVDLLRLLQVAIMQGQLTPDRLDALRTQLADEFPAGDAIMNREVVRLLVYLQESSIMDRYFDYLHSDATNPDKVHMAMYLRFLQTGWTTDRKLELFKLLNEAKGWEGGSSYPLYLSNAASDFARQLTTEESVLVVERGDEWPDAALGALYKLPRQLDDDLRAALERIDREIDQRKDTASRRLMVGIVAVLARNGDEASMAYLREIWDRNPERREPVAMGLAQQPEGDNWEYLILSLPILEDMTAREVMQRLISVDQVPDEPEHFRQIILCGLRLKDQGAVDAIALLEHWTGERLGTAEEGWETQLAAWQAWFAKQFPDSLEAVLPVESADAKWKYDELLEFVSGEEAEASDAARGSLVFEKATCIKCHRYGEQGEAMGPDLTSLTKRFTRKEILQSLLFPSHIISSQYAAQNLLLMNGRQLSGIVAPGPAGEKMVLTSEGDKVSVPEEEIDEITPSRVSAMPDGLLKDLTQEEIADLFAYLSTDPARLVAERTDTPTGQAPSSDAPRAKATVTSEEGADAAGPAAPVRASVGDKSPRRRVQRK